MKKSLKKNLYIALALFLPVFAAILSYSRFQSSFKSNTAAFNAQVGTVAGDKKTAKDTFTLPDNIPIIDNSQVLNFDSGQKNTSITYETTANESQIKKFYKKFLDENQFIKINDETYSKGNKELSIKINQSIVVINYYEK